MIAVFRLSAWMLAAAVSFATLGPPQFRPHSNLGQDGEHTLAFVLVGLAFGLAYPRQRMLTAGLSVVLIGLIEILQFWAPGRHARLEDFIVDVAAACIGFGLAAVFDWLARQVRPQTT